MTTIRIGTKFNKATDRLTRQDWDGLESDKMKMIFRFQRNWERKWSDKNYFILLFLEEPMFCIFFTWLHQQVFLRVWRWLVKTEVGSTFLPRQLRFRCDPCHVGIRNRHPQNQGRHLKSWETEQIKRSDCQWQMVMQHLSLAQTNPFTRVSNKWRRGRKTWAPEFFLLL